MAGEPGQSDKYDLLSLLTTCIETFPESPSVEEIALSNICTEETAFEREDALGSGGSFHVVEVFPGLLLAHVDSKCQLSMVYRAALLCRNSYILRSPKGQLDVSSRQGKAVMASIATERLILRNQHVRQNRNVVDLLGLCWDVTNSVDGHVMPVFVLEKANLGDLASYLRGNPNLDSRDKLRLAIQVTQGLKVVHDVGVAHCDIKPENVLIFRNDEDKLVAKLADFSASRILEECEGHVRLDAGTRFWQSPKARQRLSAAELPLTDIYSLVLVISIILTGHRLYEIINELGMAGGGRVLEELKERRALGRIIEQLMEQAETVRPSGDPDRTLVLRRRLVRFALDVDLPYALSEAGDVLMILRIIMYWILVANVQRDPQYATTFDAFECGIYVNPVDGNSNPVIDALIQIPVSEVLREPAPSLEELFRTDRNTENQHSNFASESEDDWYEQPLCPIPMHERVVRLHSYDAVISHSKSFARLRSLPSRLFPQVLRELERVTEDEAESTERRSTAAYELAAFNISSHQFGDSRNSELEKHAGFLVRAAQLGHRRARESVGLILEALRLPNSIDPDTETEWLVQSVRTSSRLAEKRLRKLNPAKCAEAARERRRIQTAAYSGSMYFRILVEETAGSERSALEAPVWDSLDATTPEFGAFCHILVLQGWLECVSRALKYPEADVNVAVEGGRTLLLEACRLGDFNMEKLLIEMGADVAACSHGLTPLHLLHQFPEEDMQPLAVILKHSGADTEAHCHASSDSLDCTDMREAMFNATPLLAAVAAVNAAAVRALIYIGADPFDLSATVPNSRNDPSMKKRWYYSPVQYASSLHQWKILRELLPQEKIYTELRTSWHVFERSFEALPIWSAIDYAKQGVWDRLLTHGPDHQLMAERTISLLFKRGAGHVMVCYDELSQAIGSAISIACLYGQPCIMKQMLEQDEPRPTAADLACIIQTGIDFDDLVVVEYLFPVIENRTRGSERENFTFNVSIQGNKGPGLIDYLIKVHERLCATPDTPIQIRFIRDEKPMIVIGPEAPGASIAQPMPEGGIWLELRVTPGPGGNSQWSFGPAESTSVPEVALDMGINEPNLLELSITGGYFESAKMLYDSGKYDVISRRAEGNGQSSLLGRLIKATKKYYTAEEQILFLLSISGLSDDVFWNVLTIDDLELSALHAAVIHLEGTEIRRPRSAILVLDKIVAKWNTPHHVNALTSLGANGQTALPLAVETGNLPAVRELAAELDDAIDWNKVNGQGETALDVAARRRQRVHEFLRESGLARDDPQYQSQFSDYCSNVVEIQRVLVDYGSRHRKYGGWVYRKSEDVWEMVNLASLEKHEPRLKQISEEFERKIRGRGDQLLSGASAQGGDEQQNESNVTEDTAHLQEQLDSWLKLRVGDGMLHPPRTGTLL